MELVRHHCTPLKYVTTLTVLYFRLRRATRILF